MKKILQILVVLVIPCIFITPAFTSCENEHPAVNVTLNSDYSGIVEAINSVNTTLSDKLALIEDAIKSGTVASGEANGLIKQALETMNGTLEEKLAAIEEAIKSQTTSLESKLGLIETALNTGFTDQKKALGEIKTALESIKGSVDGLDSAIDGVVTAIDKVTTAVDGTNTALTGAIAKALDDIFKAIDGLTDYSDILEAIKDAIEDIGPKEINGYAYVKMGDGLKWATMNIGATKPEEYGDYFAWGETAVKTDYTWSTCFDTSDDGSTTTKYATDKKTVLDLEDDAARKNWEGTWRIPTIDEWTALLNTDNFEWTWTSDYKGTGVAGEIVTSKVTGYEGNTIFLPAAGWKLYDGCYNEIDGVVYGNYWSSSLHDSRSYWAKYLLFRSDGVLDDGNEARCYGHPVRAVSD